MVTLSGGDTLPTIEFCFIQALDTVTDRKQEQNPQDYSSTGFDSVKVNPLFHVGCLRDYTLYPVIGIFCYAPQKTGDITGVGNSRSEIG
jgi:hypothetical protein